MNERELKAIVDKMVDVAVAYNGEFTTANEDYLARYYAQPYGDEQEDQSQVVSTDVSDTVESDMPSLMRVFGTERPIHVFDPATMKPEAVKEAEEKTAYVNWIINSQKNAYKIKADWIKDAEIQNMGVVRFGVRDTEKVVEREFKGFSLDEMTALIGELEASYADVRILGQDFDDGYIKVRYKKEKQAFVIENIKTEDFLISKNAASVHDAELVGDKCLVTKSALIEMGYRVDEIREIASYSQEYTDASGMDTIRFKYQGGQYENNAGHWTQEYVELKNLYPLVDYDDDGIAERRHILMAGDVILENEPFEIVPYAVMSAITMPHSAIGRGRAELVMQTQRLKTVLKRQINDNIYRVNHPDTFVNDDITEIDDLLVVRQNRIIRVAGDPNGAIMQSVTPYIGEMALQVVQYYDSERANTTGTYLSNQGLDSDQLYGETATRFLGVQEEGEAKIELVARNMAETGWRDLYEGLAWFAMTYQNAEAEISVLGKEMTVDPRKWRYDHRLTCQVGLAAGDDENVIKNMTGLLQIDAALKQTGSLLVDEKKTFNKLTKIVRAMGISKTSDMYNDPEQPNELLLAQNEKLMDTVEQLKMQLQQMQNPLAEAEMIKANKELQLDSQRLAEDRRQFNIQTSEKARQFNVDAALEATKLEVDSNKNVPGSRI